MRIALAMATCGQVQNCKFDAGTHSTKYVCTDMCVKVRFDFQVSIVIQ